MAGKLNAVILTYLVLAQSAPLAAAAQFEVYPVALTDSDGVYGPGLGVRAHFIGFDGEPILNQAGDVAFPGAVRSQGLENEGYWFHSAGVSRPIALTGEDGPLGPGLGTGAVFTNTVDNAYLSNGGDIVIGGFVSTSDSGSGEEWVWTRHVSGANVPFAREQDSGPLGPALGGDVGYEFFFVGPQVGTDNTVVFGSTLTGNGVDSSNNVGVWKRSPLDTINVLIARTGDSGAAGPGLSPRAAFISHLNGAVPTDKGNIIFTAVAENLTTDERNVGLWRNDGAGNAPIVLSGTDGELGPGLGPNQAFADGYNQVYFPFDANGQGDILFNAKLQDGRRGIWSVSGTESTPIALSGETGPLGPGLGAGVAFDSFDPTKTQVPLTLSEDEVAVFEGILAGTNRHGLWLNHQNQNLPIALTKVDDELGPQLGPDIYFTGFNRAAIRANGTVFFTADLSIDVPTNRLLGLWAYQSGRIQKIVSYGELFDVDPSSGTDQRAVEWVQISYQPMAGSNGESRNTLNQVVFRMGFTDGTQGIFLATLVPEPTTILLLIWPAVQLMHLRFRPKRIVDLHGN